MALRRFQDRRQFLKGSSYALAPALAEGRAAAVRGGRTRPGQAIGMRWHPARLLQARVLRGRRDAPAHAAVRGCGPGRFLHDCFRSRPQGPERERAPARLYPVHRSGYPRYLVGPARRTPPRPGHPLRVASAVLRRGPAEGFACLHQVRGPASGHAAPERPVRADLRCRRARTRASGLHHRIRPQSAGPTDRGRQARRREGQPGRPAEARRVSHLGPGRGREAGAASGLARQALSGTSPGSRPACRGKRGRFLPAG